VDLLVLVTGTAASIGLALVIGRMLLNGVLNQMMRHAREKDQLGL
jgi:NADP-dependent 3-hydroxy acid dehydrogenase YdfG